MRFVKILKLAQVASRPQFMNALVRHRVAAAVEHLGVVRFCSPGSVLDVGANKGQFSLAVRAICPDAVIHAFEPLPEAGNVFQRVFDGQRDVHLHRIALGSESRMAKFYVADRADSSSTLKPGEKQREAYGVKAEREITVQVERLDGQVDLAELPGPILLKIDVQGAELEVLRGISNLSAFTYIYAELSYVELYEGQSLFNDVYDHLSREGFVFRGSFSDSHTVRFGPTQSDCLFVRRERADEKWDRVA